MTRPMLTDEEWRALDDADRIRRDPLRWMLGVAEARLAHAGERERTLDLKFTRGALAMWIAHAEKAFRALRERETEAEAALREVTPHACGGYGDFPPDGGWDAWEDRHARVLARIEDATPPAPGGETPGHTGGDR